MKQKIKHLIQTVAGNKLLTLSFLVSIVLMIAMFSSIGSEGYQSILNKFKTSATQSLSEPGQISIKKDVRVGNDRNSQFMRREKKIEPVTYNHNETAITIDFF